MAELVDAHDSNSCSERSVGSIPTLGTKKLNIYVGLFYYLFLKSFGKPVINIDFCVVDGNLLFPVFLRLDKLQILVVGGGVVGTEKTLAIFNSSPNAHVNLVAP